MSGDLIDETHRRFDWLIGRSKELNSVCYIKHPATEFWRMAPGPLMKPSVLAHKKVHSADVKRM
ncbi:hypothetical protein BCBD1442_29240 [Brucella ceti]|nr:hypothetical protein BCBD1442_29240 [Brucella ceti]